MKSVEIIEAEQVSASLGDDYSTRAGVWAQTARALDDALWAARHRVDLLQKEQHADVERWNQANTEAQALIQTLGEVLQNLVVKLDAMVEPLNSVCVIAHIHGMPYIGPMWTDELNAAKALLVEGTYLKPVPVDSGLREKVEKLPRYQEHDVVQRPSTAEYFSVDDVLDLIDAAPKGA